MTRPSLAQGAATQGVLRLVSVAALAGVSVAVGRLFGPAGAGAFALCSTVLLLGMTFSTVGLDIGLGFLVSGARISAAKAVADARLAALTLGAGGSLLILGAIALGPADAFAQVPAAAWLFVLLALPPGLYWTFVTTIALAANSYRAAAGLPGIQVSAYVLAVVVLGLLTGLPGAIAGLLVGHVFAAVAAEIWTRRSIGPSSRPDRDSLGRAISFGFRPWAGLLLSMIQRRADLLVLGAFVSASDVGAYAVALALTSLLWAVTSGFSAVFFPRIAAARAAVADSETTTSTPGRQAIEARMVRSTVLVVAVGAALVAVALIFLLVPVYGAAFSSGIRLGLILLPGGVALALTTVVNSILTGMDRTALVLRGSLASASVATLLYLLMIPQLGAVGAAIASTVSGGVALLVAFLYLRREGQVGFFDAFVPGVSDLESIVQLLRRRRAPRQA